MSVDALCVLLHCALGFFPLFRCNTHTCSYEVYLVGIQVPLQYLQCYNDSRSYGTCLGAPGDGVISAACMHAGAGCDAIGVPGIEPCSHGSRRLLFRVPDVANRQLHDVAEQPGRPRNEPLGPVLLPAGCIHAGEHCCVCRRGAQIQVQSCEAPRSTATGRWPAVTRCTAGRYSRPWCARPLCFAAFCSSCIHLMVPSVRFGTKTHQ